MNFHEFHKAPSGNWRKYDYDEIERVAVEAYNNGVAMSRAVAERFQVSQSRASAMIHNARLSGHNIPFVGQGRYPDYVRKKRR